MALVLPPLPDFRQLASSQGCEHALDEAIKAIEVLAELAAAEEESLAAAQAALISQQDTIASQEDTIASQQALITQLQGGDRRPVSLRLSVAKKEENMATQITVDTTNEEVVLTFQDDHGDSTTAPTSPDGSPAVLTATSDTPTVLTVGAFTENPTGASDGGPNYVAPITPVAEGAANVGATVTDDTGAPIPLPVPTTTATNFSDEVVPVTVQVVAGAAAGLTLSVD